MDGGWIVVKREAVLWQAWMAGDPALYRGCRKTRRVRKVDL
jgi:hypothetical protein